MVEGRWRLFFRTNWPMPVHDHDAAYRVGVSGGLPVIALNGHVDRDEFRRSSHPYAAYAAVNASEAEKYRLVASNTGAERALCRGAFERALWEAIKQEPNRQRELARQP